MDRAGNYLPLVTYRSETTILTMALRRKRSNDQREMNIVPRGRKKKKEHHAIKSRSRSGYPDHCIRKWSWAGHVILRTNNRLAVRMTEVQREMEEKKRAHRDADEKARSENAQKRVGKKLSRQRDEWMLGKKPRQAAEKIHPRIIIK